MNCLAKTLFVGFLVASLSAARVWAGASVNYEYDKYGNCTAITTVAANNVVLEKTTYTYDAYKRCTAMVEAADTPQSRVWNWSYDGEFETPTGSRHYFDGSTHTSKQWRQQTEPAYDAAGNRNVTQRVFDLNDRIVEEKTGVIQGAGGTYDGPDVAVQHFSYYENGLKKTYTDPLTRLTTYVYDNRNRLWQTIEPMNRITETLYDHAGNKTDVTFPDTKSQHWQNYDAFGQAGRFIDERNNQTDLAYQSGPMKKLTSATTYRDKDDGGTEAQPTTFEYDGMGRAKKVTFPDHSTEVSNYQYGSQLASWKSRRDQTKTIAYDARGREISNSWVNDAAPAIHRSWDDANRALTLCNIYSMIDYQYDGAGLVIAEGNTISGSQGRALTTYERYPNGNVSRIVYPNSLSIRRDYNARGQLSATGSSDSNNNWLAMFASYQYRQDGKLDYRDYINGVHTAFGYDDRGFLNHETVTRGGPTYAERTYYRDQRDRIIAFQKGSGNPSNPMEDGHGDHYWYDPEGQLTDANYGAVDPVNNPHLPVRTDHFEYDQLGNRRRNSANGSDNLLATKGWMQFTRKDNGLNQYSGWWPYGGIKYDDDVSGEGTPGHANGVLMQDGWINGEYSALNQPIVITNNAVPSKSMFFGYDPLGRCVKRVLGASINSGTATYLYYDGWSVIQEGPNVATMDRVYVLGNRVDEIVADYGMANGQWIYHQSEARGHCMLLTDSSGNLAEQYEYDAFGYPYFFSSTGQTLTSSAFGNRFLFTGREYLSDLKLYDYRNRMYQPEMGRFMQPDPKEFAAGDYNLYRYCHNDPVNKTDPFGDDWLEFNGSIVTWYPGNLGDRRNPLFSVSGISGKVGHQGASNSNEFGKGAIPPGDYKINTALDPSRRAQIIPKGQRHEGEYYSGRGIQQTEGEDWGTERARLEKAPRNPTDRDNFYLHNSDKGQTSGCVEAPSKLLWNQLHKHHDSGKRELPVRVNYEMKPK